MGIRLKMEQIKQYENPTEKDLISNNLILIGNNTKLIKINTYLIISVFVVNIILGWLK